MKSMTSAVKVLLVACLALLVSFSQPRQATAGLDVWTGYGPEGGTIRALAIDPVTPTTLYAGSCCGGVFKSTDGGTSWRMINTGLTDTGIRALAIDPVTPTTLYAGTCCGGGVFKSTDGGERWSAINTGLTDTNVNVLAIDPLTPTTLYVGSY